MCVEFKYFIGTRRLQSQRVYRIPTNSDMVSNTSINLICMFQNVNYCETSEKFSNIAAKVISFLF